MAIEIQREEYGICPNCPTALEVEAAERASQRLLDEDVITPQVKRFGEFLRDTRTVALQETCKIHQCPGAKEDDDGTLRCPQPWGRVGSLIAGDDNSHLTVASNMVSRRNVGFQDRS